MNPRKQELIEYIQRSINSICSYENEHTKRLYHIGFLSSILADLMYTDSMTLDKFKQRIRAAQRKSQEHKL